MLLTFGGYGMNRNGQTSPAGILTVLGILALLGVGYLVFVFPAKIAEWADQERAPSVVEMALVNLSGFCKSFSLLLIPVLLACTIGCGVWMVRSRRARNA